MVALRMFPMVVEVNQQDESLYGQDFLKKKKKKKSIFVRRMIDQTIGREEFVVEYIDVDDIFNQIV